MRLFASGLIGLVLSTGMLRAQSSLQTVIVEPVSRNRVIGASFATREEAVRAYQTEARTSQAGLIDFLRPLAFGRSNAPVTAIHPLWLVNRVIITATPEVIAQLKKRSDVASVRDDFVVELQDPHRETVVGPDEANLTYGLKKIRAQEAWQELGFTGNGVVVGHLDTGVHANHPALAGKVIKFKDFHASDNEVGFDGQGHGTHTAGTIVGGDAGGGSIGVAPGAKLIVGRIFDASGVTTGAIILRAMNWIADPDGNPATNDAPRIISNSWGGEKDTDKTGGELWDACQRWVDLGIFPVFAAGNSGPFGKVGTPGAYPHVLAVGSTNWFNWLSFFSSKGPSVWEGTTITKPDVCAPGSQVYSAKDGGGYVKLDGTSMACPHVAGVAALMLEANPNLKIPQLVEILRGTAKDLGATGPDNKFGWGLVDAFAACEKAKALRKFDGAD